MSHHHKEKIRKVKHLEKSRDPTNSESSSHSEADEPRAHSHKAECSRTEEYEKRYERSEKNESEAGNLEERLRDKLMKRVEKREKKEVESQKKSHTDSSHSKKERFSSDHQNRGRFIFSDRRSRSKSLSDRHKKHHRKERSRSRSPERQRRHSDRSSHSTSKHRSRSSRSRSPDFYHRKRYRNDRRSRERIISRANCERFKHRRQAEPVPLHLNTKVIKHAEEIQKRKLLWQKSGDQQKTSSWSSLLAATCSDDKSTEKFKKLMGIKGRSDETVQTMDTGVQRAKQAELFHNLDVQYESARMSTHTHRGVGLGFSTQMMEIAAQTKAAQENENL